MFFGGGFFIGASKQSQEVPKGSDVVNIDGKIIYAPSSDNIYIDENNNVFYSEGRKNGMLFVDSGGTVYARRLT